MLLLLPGFLLINGIRRPLSLGVPQEIVSRAKSTAVPAGSD